MMKFVFALLALAVAGASVASPANTAPAPATPAAAAAAHNAGPSANMPTPNKGKVLEVIDTAMYTYIQVSGDKKPVWIAASKMKAVKGDTISYSNGPVMTNFHSKTLNRTFDSIVFVDKAVVGKK